MSKAKLRSASDFLAWEALSDNEWLEGRVAEHCWRRGVGFTMLRLAFPGERLWA